MNVLLTPLTEHFTLKVSQNMQEAISFHFAEMSPLAHIFFPDEPGLFYNMFFKLAYILQGNCLV